MRRLLRALTIPVVCAAAGFFLAHNGSGASTAAPVPLSGAASTAGFDVRYPADWRLRPPSQVPHLPLDGAILLAPAATAGRAAAGQLPASPELVIGTAHPAHPEALTVGLRSLLGIVPLPETVLLGGMNLVRYAGAVTRDHGVTEWIYLLPTSRGTVTAICSAADLTGALAATCERILATLRISGGSVLSLGADPAYALKVNRILTGLEAVRRSARPGLAGTDPKGIAAAAARLGGAQRRAAAAAERIAGVAVSVANGGLVQALRRGAHAYSDLSAAAAGGDARRYGAAQGEVARAERALVRAYRRLRSVGYRVA